MKKLVLSVMAVAAFGFAANAQEKEKPSFGFQENNVFIEGTFQLSDVKVTDKTNVGVDEKVTTFQVNPKIGYMLNDKFAVGVSLGFGKIGANDDMFDGANMGDAAYVKTTYAGAFARYYFLELGNRFKTYTEVGIGFSQGKADVLGEDVKATGIQAGIDLGFNYFLTENLAVAFNLGNVFSYSNHNVKVAGDKVATVANTNANVNIFNNFFDNAKFGLTYKF